jgi:hypothetical protein
VVVEGVVDFEDDSVDDEEGDDSDAVGFAEDSAAGLLSDEEPAPGSAGLLSVEPLAAFGA